ncbi:hypothetical protein LINPERHAP1_LOCUS13054 [Linum perenne]
MEAKHNQENALLVVAFLSSTPQMSWLSGSTEDTWHPVMSGDTTRTSYWLNWRFLLCAAWILVSMTIAFVLIWRNEQNCQHHEMEQDDDEEEEEGFMYDDQAWMPCLKGVHPAWLLSFRICAFLVLLLLLIASVLVDGNTIFYYYTQWTFTLVTFYFAIGSLMSIGGCFKYNKRVGNVELDAEHGGRGMKGSNSSHYHHTAVEDRQPAGKLVYAFQIIFQINAGAVMLTDCVFWFIIVPFLAIKDFHLSALTICMHSMNAIFLLGDTALNCLPFPIFRIAYFILWTIIYVLFQWFLHAFVKIWYKLKPLQLAFWFYEQVIYICRLFVNRWPYPFLDISSPYVPLWYFAVAVMHIPCYGVYAFIVKLKNTWFTRWFLDSYRGWS